MGLNCACMYEYVATVAIDIANAAWVVSDS